jgi:hypothetical protein
VPRYLKLKTHFKEYWSKRISFPEFKPSGKQFFFWHFDILLKDTWFRKILNSRKKIVFSHFLQSCYKILKWHENRTWYFKSIKNTLRIHTQNLVILRKSITKINFSKQSFNVLMFNYLHLKTLSKFKNLIRKGSGGQNM